MIELLKATPLELLPEFTLVVLQGNRLLGMGSGQPNRVKSLQIAVEKAGDEVQGSALASDAFFPFGESNGFLCSGPSSEG